MERLTQASNSGGVAFTFDLDITCQPSEARKILNLATKLKDYEDLEEQGKLIKLPCKIGDKVWHISGRDIKEDVISGIEYSYDGMFYIWSNEDTWLGGFNDIVFLTKSEAEAKLKELRGEENESSNLHT